MMPSLIRRFEQRLLARPWWTLAAVIAACALFASWIPDFRLDASADSLLLEGDPDLRYYRAIRARYGSDDYLIITWSLSPDRDLFDDAELAVLGRLRDQLRALPGIEKVTTILDVPLLASPPITLEELQQSVPTLLSPRTDRALARRELTESPLYRQLLMSIDGKTTAILINLQKDETFERLLRERDDLWLRELETGLDTQQRQRLQALERDIDQRREQQLGSQRRIIAEIRALLAGYSGQATIRIGGLPLIAVDMLNFILRDVVVFGAGILIFLLILLAMIFRRPRWVLLPILSCSAAAVVMLGLLGKLGWPVTVVSANFVALLLIFCLSLTVHLIVRYQELHAQHPAAEQRWLVLETARDKWLPCAYNAATTMVAFGSLIVSGIRPVIDFGWLMVIGMGVVLMMSFVLFPAGLCVVPAGRPQPIGGLTGRVTHGLAAWIDRQPRVALSAFASLALLCGFGLTQLRVENRFIDNFKDSTDIYQGLVTIDRELGGTTPLDVILDADPAFLERRAAGGVVTGTPGGVAGEVDEFADEPDEFAGEIDEFAAEPAATDLGASSYWYNSFQLQRLGRIHDYLDSLPETGKVLSLDTTIDTLRVVNEGREPTTFFMSLLYKNLPAEIKAALFDPYMAPDGNQVRISVRVFESDPHLRRQALLDQIRGELLDGFGLKPAQVHLTGMLVLYNNVLQSLYRSQILTLGFVFLAILAMFVLLFRSLRIALIALTPNLLAATFVLGIMGLTGVPLDIMTITIAAITIGIGVDDSIHYVHRFMAEFAEHGDYRQAMHRSHASIGRAMYYTSIIIAAGFSILVLSNFIPTIFFGLFTALAMLFAMVANLTLLPLLLIRLRPLGPGSAASVT